MFIETKRARTTKHEIKGGYTSKKKQRPNPVNSGRASSLTFWDACPNARVRPNETKEDSSEGERISSGSFEKPLPSFAPLAVQSRNSPGQQIRTYAPCRSLFFPGMLLGEESPFRKGNACPPLVFPRPRATKCSRVLEYTLRKLGPIVGLRVLTENTFLELTTTSWKLSRKKYVFVVFWL